MSPTLTLRQRGRTQRVPPSERQARFLRTECEGPQREGLRRGAPGPVPLQNSTCWVTCGFVGTALFVVFVDQIAEHCATPSLKGANSRLFGGWGLLEASVPVAGVVVAYGPEP